MLQKTLLYYGPPIATLGATYVGMLKTGQLGLNVIETPGVAIASGHEANEASNRYLVAFVELSISGDHQGALLAASEACYAAPAMAEAHYAYGQAWLAAESPAEAAQAFGRAIKLRPSWADAWVNYGLARYALGAVRDARIAMEQALTVEPGHPAATANLAAFLRLAGDHEAAMSLLTEALACNPQDYGARLNLAAERLQEEQPEAALALLDAVDPPAAGDPAIRHWHLQRAFALIALGRTGGARDALAAFDAQGPAPRELAPLRLWRETLLAVAEGRATDARGHAAAMEAALADMGPNAVLEHRIMARYDLAKFWSALGEDAKAFTQWRDAHALLRPVQPFSRAATRARGDAAMAIFTQARFESGPRARNSDPAPVFVVGMPRSGTTLAAQILAAHPQAHSAGKRTALAQLAAKLGGGDGPDAIARIAALDQAALDAAAAAYLAELHALAPGKSRIIDKMPGNYAYVWLIALLFPNAKIIHCIRDPRDIGVSIFTFRFHGDHGYAHDLADLGWMIGEQERLMLHWAAVLPVLTLPMADWVTDFDTTLARLLSFVDVPPDPGCARFHEAAGEVRTVSRSQVRAPINARGLGRWRRYAGELEPLIAALAQAGALEGWD